MPRPSTGRKEYAFFTLLTEEERAKAKENMEWLKQFHGIAFSALLRKILLEKISEEDFLKFIGMK